VITQEEIKASAMLQQVFRRSTSLIQNKCCIKLLKIKALFLKDQRVTHLMQTGLIQDKSITIKTTFSTAQIDKIFSSETRILFTCLKTILSTSKKVQQQLINTALVICNNKI